jgi:hypothetical protein
MTGTEVPLPAMDGAPDEVVDRTARAILHRPLGEQTRATVLAALGASEVMPDGERRRLDGAKLVGLLLGAPEFQTQ